MDIEDILLLIENAIKSNKTKLDLSNRDINELPDEIGKLTKLKSLNLSYNSLIAIPASIGKLENLEEIFLTKNCLEIIPDEFGKLQKLKILDLSNNKITNIPKSISNLSNLQVLDVSYCQSETLPEDFPKLTNLRDLSLEGNKFTFPPQKIIKRGLYATMHYLTEEQRKKEHTDTIIQIINMPSNIQLAFRQYLNGFSELIKTDNINSQNLILNFTNTKVSEIYKDHEDSILSKVSLINKTINEISANELRKKEDKKTILQDLQNQFAIISNALLQEMNGIKEIHNELERIAKKLDQI